jgi:hypothetical protein
MMAFLLAPARLAVAPITIPNTVSARYNMLALLQVIHEYDYVI